MTLQRLLEDRAEKFQAIEALQKRNAAGQFTAEDEKAWDSAWAEYDACNDQIGRARRFESAGELLDAERQPDPATRGVPGFGGITALSNARGRHSTAGEEWRDIKGQPLLVTRNGTSHAAHYDRVRSDDQPAIDVGKLMRAGATMDFSDFTPEERALSGVVGSSGGFFLQPKTANQFLDVVRAKSRVMAAGAALMTMDSPTVILPRVTGDVDTTWHAEGQQIPSGDPTFGAVQAEAHTLTTDVVRVSNEVLQDGVGLDAALRETMAKAMAKAIDTIALSGTGAANEPAGLLNTATSTTGSIGSLTFDDLLVALRQIMVLNHDPNAYIINPNNAEDLWLLKDGDGSTSADSYKRQPQALDPLQQFITTTMPSTTFLMGDFRQVVIATRSQMQLRVLVELYADYNETGFVMTWRGDILTLYPDAFATGSGLTT